MAWDDGFYIVDVLIRFIRHRRILNHFIIQNHLSLTLKQIFNKSVVVLIFSPIIEAHQGMIGWFAELKNNDIYIPQGYGGSN